MSRDKNVVYYSEVLGKTKKNKNKKQLHSWPLGCLTSVIEVLQVLVQGIMRPLACNLLLWTLCPEGLLYL